MNKERLIKDRHTYNKILALSLENQGIKVSIMDLNKLEIS